MASLHDEELIAALQERFDTNRRAISDLRNITEKLEATNRRLQESEALKGHFLSNIRNEINNPLTAIMGFACQLMEGNATPSQVVFNGRLIYDEAFELNFKLENVFTAAGLEAGQEMPAPARIDVAAVLAQVLGSLEHRRVEKDVVILRRFADAIPFVTDPRFLRIMFGNLVANALEFSPSYGVVTVLVTSDDRFLRISVGDEGSGIDAADHETAFDRFRQLDVGRCKSHRGLGLGLSICRALAELLGGQIGIDSALGTGSTFTLSLPLLTAEEMALVPEENLFFAAPEQF